jgi:hypothetical protein
MEVNKGGCVRFEACRDGGRQAGGAIDGSGTRNKDVVKGESGG